MLNVASGFVDSETYKLHANHCVKKITLPTINRIVHTNAMPSENMRIQKMHCVHTFASAASFFCQAFFVNPYDGSDCGFTVETGAYYFQTNISREKPQKITNTEQSSDLKCNESKLLK